MFSETIERSRVEYALRRAGINRYQIIDEYSLRPCYEQPCFAVMIYATTKGPHSHNLAVDFHVALSSTFTERNEARERLVGDSKLEDRPTGHLWYFPGFALTG